MISFQKHTSHKNIWIIFIASKQGASNHDIEDVISGCKDNEFCNACPDNQNKETNVVKRRRYRLNILKSLLLNVPKLHHRLLPLSYLIRIFFLGVIVKIVVHFLRDMMHLQLMMQQMRNQVHYR